MLVQILSVRYLVVPVTDRQKITEGDRADGLTIRHTYKQLTFYSRMTKTIDQDQVPSLTISKTNLLHFAGCSMHGFLYGMINKTQWSNYVILRILYSRDFHE